MGKLRISNDELERVLHGCASEEAEYKQNKAYVKELDLFLMQQEWENVEIGDFKYKKDILSGRDNFQIFL